MRRDSNFNEQVHDALMGVSEQCKTLLSRCEAISTMAEGVDPQNPLISKARTVAYHLQGAASSLSSLMLHNGTARLKLERVEEEGQKEKIVVRCVSSLMDDTAAANPSARPDARKGLQGYSWALAVPEFLSCLASLKKTGTLEVTSLNETFLLLLEDGEVIHAASNNSPAGLRLGDVLVAQGSMTQDLLQLFLRQSKGSQRRLGAALVEDGLVSEEQLRDALTYQVRQLFHRIYGCETANYCFYEDINAVKHGVRMDVTELLLESALELDADRHAPQAGSASASN